jgi:hypothetical protein
MLETSKARDEAAELSRHRPVEAFRAARKIADPWFAVQAMAWVARFAPPDLAAKALDEARATAKAGRDAYQRSAVLAWPVRAAIETGDTRRADEMLADAVALLPKVRQAASRVEAGSLLLEAAFPGGPTLWQPALSAIEAHCPPDADRRIARIYRLMSHVVATADREATQRLAEAIPAGRDRDRALQELKAGTQAAPRAFFG